ncbi:uncharacterized protein MICPUCDRAFT_41932 [Micromonas pusilla CCMP1545]|uniref:Predicted protein n=1 Tax=Micromonas pusilla (strain CCMP1545) TaxID=564608 RepID=C1N1U8_MICPC|nr:uncharacterized protein MICPUCDRAFT_41932 [Micromonas pusilla CCMP1545]EEH53688.1 predicted protein [Micromonas pusilla CCMP1545]|eukprot:XP_003061976.1 predicted protein [Micromonas pusilla CCMP1545]
MPTPASTTAIPARVARALPRASRRAASRGTRGARLPTRAGSAAGDDGRIDGNIASDPAASDASPDVARRRGRRSVLASAIAVATTTTGGANVANGGADGGAAFALRSTLIRPGAAAAAAATVDAPALAPFVGKAGFLLRYPNGWVKATDRPGNDDAKGGETLALLGNFKDIDTVSVRREPLSLHADFVEAAAGWDATVIGGGYDRHDDVVARKVAESLTRAERAAVDANQNFGVVGGVENGKSGVMDFAFVGPSSCAVASGAEPGSTQPYFSYDYVTEVCRAEVEEGLGGEKMCVGPRGDVLDTIRRRNFVVATDSGGWLYLVKASALETRWEDDRLGAPDATGNARNDRYTTLRERNEWTRARPRRRQSTRAREAAAVMGVFSCLAPPPRAASVPPSRKRIPPAADATTTTAAAAPASELSEAGSGDRSPSPSSSFVSRTRSLSDVTAHAIEEERARRQSRAVSDRDLPPPVWDALSDSLLEASARRLRARDPPPEEKRMWETYHALKALAPIPAFGGGGGGEEESGTNNNAHSSGVTNNNNSTERRVPTTPTTLAKLAEDGLMRGDDDWARREDVRALLADDVVYHTADGLTLEGVERVIDKMCDQTARLAKRMKRSRRQRAEGKEGGGGAAAAASMKQAKIKTSGPTYAGNGVWVMSYEFSMMLMKVRIREEFILEEGTERVKDLRRVRV